MVAALVGAGAIGRQVYHAPGPLEQGTAVVVPRGMRHAAAVLFEAHVVGSPLALRLAALLTPGDGPIHAAEFAFPAHASLRAVLDMLRHARPVQHRLTLPEGLTAAQIVTLVDGAEALDGQAVKPAEGAVLPQTYDYVYGTTRAALLARSEAAMQRTLADAWAGRDAASPLTSPRQALILASIVERETGLAEERAHVAAVFLNRLRLGMRLQSDPTVLYGASQGLGSLDRPLTRDDLELDDPYNTYRIAGLPPGPICSPGTAAIEAVLHPAASADLYFVATGAGGHAFSASLVEHERHVRAYRERSEGK